VSTKEQTTENQERELRQWATGDSAKSPRGIEARNRAIGRDFGGGRGECRQLKVSA
jgi:hypothetical protein